MGAADIDYRTWGATRTCKGCRYWSELVARAEGGGPVQALCLNPESPMRNEYMSPNRTCPEWKNGGLGAVDQPGGNPTQDDLERAIADQTPVEESQAQRDIPT